ncbi:MAG: tRNA uridine-5-carboxymethylaminomethyl(34) synthesis GTPase MnmE [Desulfatitalea sp.]|nr:tRNA uridine-5-carboxymethylaminomethyl(34) synthesis GTPase MnmE [Desulfatitalea sp.]
MNVRDTIAATATPIGLGGIGIIRISGEQAKSILCAIFRCDSVPGAKGVTLQGCPIVSHRFHHGYIFDPRSDEIIDEVMAVLMSAPRSYTREDVVEIQCHGGPAVLECILSLVIDLGARTAQPGEFTQRAFLNGRIDLSQAEAVADLITAQNRGATVLAARQVRGEIKQTVRQFVMALNSARAEIEALIEFPDDLDDHLDREGLSAMLQRDVLGPITKLVHSYAKGRAVRDGYRVSITGRPNVGKSSLLNKLASAEKAIVTPIAGTTRDVILADCIMGTLPLVLSDAAGIRGSDDPIEKIGVQRALQCAEQADLVLLVVSAEEGFTPDDRAILERYSRLPGILVINKIDLVDAVDRSELSAETLPWPVLNVSALTGQGLKSLREAIVDKGSGTASEKFTDVLVSNIRHKKCFEEALMAVQQAIEGLTNGISEDMVSFDLQQAVRSLQLITGEALDEQMLDTIFQRFCIGK